MLEHHPRFEVEVQQGYRRVQKVTEHQIEALLSGHFFHGRAEMRAIALSQKVGQSVGLVGYDFCVKLSRVPFCLSPEHWSVACEHWLHFRQRACRAGWIGERAGWNPVFR